MALKSSRLRNLEMTLGRCSSLSSLRNGEPSCEHIAKVAMSPWSSKSITSESTLFSLERLDERLSNRIAQVERHMEEGLQAILKPLEAKVGNLEKQQPLIEWQLTDLDGTVKAFGEQLQTQARQCSFLTSAVQGLKEHQGYASRESWLSIQDVVPDCLDVCRRLTRLEEGICTSRVGFATREELQALTAEVDQVSHSCALNTNLQSVVTHAELDGAINLLRGELRSEARDRASTLGEFAADDIHRELKSLREEMGQVQIRSDLLSATYKSEIEQQVLKVREKVPSTLTDQIRKELERMDLIGGVSKIIHTIQDINEKSQQQQHELLLTQTQLHDLRPHITSLEEHIQFIFEATGHTAEAPQRSLSCVGIREDREMD